MRHGKSNRKFGLERKVRVALLRSLARALIENEKITTTEAKAKELRPYVERLVTYGKSASLSKRRLALQALGGNKESVSKLMTLAPRYKDRAGGYTRIIKMPIRKSDGAHMARIDFV